MSVIKNLKFGWSKNKTLFDIPKWDLPDKGVSALMGASGSGKSSLLRCLLGLEDCEGQWELGGVDVLQLPISQRNFSIVFQSLELFPHMTAIENILFTIPKKDKEALSKVDDLVGRLGLQGCLKTPAVNLSGGEAQRVALARALACKPRFLFLDEPFSSLDSVIKKEARSLVRKTLVEEEIPSLIITHDEEDVKAVSDYSFFLKEGTIHS